MLYLTILGGVSCCCEGSSPSHPDPPFLLDSSQPVLDISTKLQLYHRHCCQFHGFGPGARAGHWYLFIRASTSIQLPFLTLTIQTLLVPGIEPETINQGLTLLHYCKSLPFFYFLTFEKGRLLYFHPVGWSVGVIINFFNIYRHKSPLFTQYHSIPI